MTRAHQFALGTMLGALGLVFVAAGHGEGTVAAPDLAKLVNMEVKHINGELSKSTFSKKGQKRVRMAAFMIAVYAQNAKDNAAAMATLRDQALKLMQAAEAGKADEAKKLAATLVPDIKPNPAAKTAPIALEKQLDLETLMRMFSSDKVGGFGVEKALEDLVDAKGLDAGQLEKTALLGQKLSLIARLAHAYAPQSDSGSKTKKTWNALATEMETGATELAAAAGARKDADIGKLANKLTATCTKCHDIFR
jgi:hypothetical protein